MVQSIFALLAIVSWLGIESTGASRFASAKAELQPNRPTPMPITLNPATTAVLVLDLSARCDNSEEVCSQLIPSIKQFLPRARASNVFVAYSVSLAARGTPLGNIAVGIEPMSGEPVVYPDHLRQVRRRRATELAGGAGDRDARHYGLFLQLGGDVHGEHGRAISSVSGRDPCGWH